MCVCVCVSEVFNVELITCVIRTTPWSLVFGVQQKADKQSDFSLLKFVFSGVASEHDIVCCTACAYERERVVVVGGTLLRLPRLESEVSVSTALISKPQTTQKHTVCPLTLFTPASPSFVLEDQLMKLENIIGYSYSNLDVKKVRSMWTSPAILVFFIIEY